ncbi:hypothetical protein [Amycolatopsis sp. NPDC051071]|uniref:hypothetical protein n=1 Tax=Amycolatopsis sp. NPDC051071 TaxID=3154637 RepID=UPI003436717B
MASWTTGPGVALSESPRLDNIHIWLRIAALFAGENSPMIDHHYSYPALNANLKTTGVIA